MVGIAEDRDGTRRVTNEYIGNLYPGSKALAAGKSFEIREATGLLAR